MAFPFLACVFALVGPQTAAQSGHKVASQQPYERNELLRLATRTRRPFGGEQVRTRSLFGL